MYCVQYSIVCTVHCTLNTLPIRNIFNLSSQHIPINGQLHQNYHIIIMQLQYLTLISYFNSLASCLKTLVQLRSGRMWTFGLQNNVIDNITRFTCDIMNEGLVAKILNILVQTGEFSLLQKPITYIQKVIEDKD